MELKDLKEKSNYVLISDINISKDGGYFTLKKGEIIGCESILKNEFMALYSFLYISDSNICETMRFTNASIDGLLRVIEPYFINEDKTNDIKKSTNKSQETTPVIGSDVLDYHKIYNIPSEIKLISTKIKVIFKELNNGLNEEELIDKGVHFGHAIYTTNTIELQIPRFKIIQYDVKHIYYHELLHWIFYVMGKTNLNDDESFIDLTSNLLLQAMEG